MVDGVVRRNAGGFVVVFPALGQVPVKAVLQIPLEQNFCRW